MNFDSEQPDLTVTNAEFVSPYGKYEIGQHTGVETDWYNLQTESIASDSLVIQHTDIQYEERAEEKNLFSTTGLNRC